MSDALQPHRHHRRAGTQPTLSTAFVQPRTAPLPPRKGSLPSSHILHGAAPPQQYIHFPRPTRSSSLRRNEALRPVEAVQSRVANGRGRAPAPANDVEEIQTIEIKRRLYPRRPPGSADSTATSTSSPHLVSMPTATLVFPAPTRTFSHTDEITELPPAPAPAIRTARFASPSPSTRPTPLPPSTYPSPSPSPASSPIGVGVDLFRWARPTRGRSQSGNESPRSIFEDDDDADGFWRRGVELARSKSRRREKAAREVDHDEMEVLQDAEEFAAKVAPPERGLQRSASTSQLPSAGATGLRRLLSLSDRQKSHSASSSLSSLSSLTSLPSLGLVRKNSSAGEGPPPNRLRKPRPPHHRCAGRDGPHGGRPFGEDSPASLFVTLEDRSRRRSASLPPSFIPRLPLAGQEEATDEILRIGGYGGCDPAPAYEVTPSGSSRLQRKDVRERAGRAADWRQQVQHRGGERESVGSSFFEPFDSDDDETRPSVIGFFTEPPPRSPFPRPSPPPPQPDVPVSPPTFTFHPSRSSPPCSPSLDVPETPTIDFTAIAQTQPLRLNRPAAAPTVSFAHPPPAPTPSSYADRPFSASSSVYSTDTYDPFALHIPLYTVPSEQPIPSPSHFSPRRLPPPSPLRTHRAKVDSEDSMGGARVSRVEQVALWRQASLVRSSSVRSAMSGTGTAL